MEIPLNAQVECTDGVCGRSLYVLINPVVDQVTHLVVKENSSPNTEYIVPVDLVTNSTAEKIQLSCSKVDLEEMEPFIKTTYIQETIPDRYSGGGSVGLGSMYYMPYVTPDITVYEEEETQQIPEGELTVRRGTRVEATDGYVGHVDELVVSPENGHITHLVMREGHFWGKKDVIIPLSAMAAMDETHEDTVRLNLAKHQIEALPTFPLHRHWS